MAGELSHRNLATAISEEDSQERTVERVGEGSVLSQGTRLLASRRLEYQPVLENFDAEFSESGVRTKRSPGSILQRYDY